MEELSPYATIEASDEQSTRRTAILFFPAIGILTENRTAGGTNLGEILH